MRTRVPVLRKEEKKKPPKTIETEITNRFITIILARSYTAATIIPRYRIALELRLKLMTTALAHTLNGWLSNRPIGIVIYRGKFVFDGIIFTRVL